MGSNGAYPNFEYLLCIPSFEIGSEPVISFFKKGKSFFGDLPFLQFCKKYDICNQHELNSGCCFGKLGPQQLKYPARIPPVN
jgi:hypothetical protein